MSSGIHTLHTSLVGESPEITAPIRTEGESDSDVLFNWLDYHGFLWMLTPPHDDELQRIAGSSVALELAFRLMKWERQQGRKPPKAPLLATRQQGFARLEKLIKAHFFDRSKMDDA